MNGIFDLGAKCHVQGGDRIFDDIAEYMEARIEEPEYKSAGGFARPFGASCVKH